MKKIKVIALVSMCAIALGACQHKPLTGTTYTRGETLEAQKVSKGVVVDIQDVKIEKDVTGAGAAIGGVIGGIATNGTNGSGTKQIIQIIAATAGAFVGEFVENKASIKQGIEIVVDMEDGESISIVQAVDEQSFQVGDEIRIVDNGRKARVVKVNN